MAIAYGSAPVDMGFFNPNTDEMMLYLYLPIKMPGGAVMLPPRLQRYKPMVMAVRDDLGGDWLDDHVYITAKTQWVEPGSPGNRPGWHADGYGSGGDLNYIWADMNPTEFAVQEFHDIPDDDWQSMVEMERQIDPMKITVYADKHLLKLDESVVHRVNESPVSGVRTFVKISVSKHRYNLRGNSRNYLIDYDWPMFDRADRRNIDNRDFVEEPA